MCDFAAEVAPYRDPFRGGEPVETLFYIPPPEKGVVFSSKLWDRAGATLINELLYWLTPPRRVPIDARLPRSSRGGS
jgi:hypothetical protein